MNDKGNKGYLQEAPHVIDPVRMLKTLEHPLEHLEMISDDYECVNIHKVIQALGDSFQIFHPQK